MGFSQYFEYIIPFSLDLWGFCWETWWYSYRDSLLYDALLLLFSKVCLCLWILNIQLLHVLIYTSLILPSWDLWASWIWKSIYFPRLGNFSALISLNKFSTFFLCIVVQFSSVKSLSRVRLSATPWNASCQSSLSITSSQSLPKLMSI